MQALQESVDQSFCFTVVWQEFTQSRAGHVTEGVVRQRAASGSKNTQVRVNQTISMQGV